MQPEMGHLWSLARCWPSRPICLNHAYRAMYYGNGKKKFVQDRPVSGASGPLTPSRLVVLFSSPQGGPTPQRPSWGSTPPSTTSPRRSATPWPPASGAGFCLGKVELRGLDWAGLVWHERVVRTRWPPHKVTFWPRGAANEPAPPPACRPPQATATAVSLWATHALLREEGNLGPPREGSGLWGV